MRALRQIVRGCGTLPHVGSHPGSATVVFLTIITGLAASRGESLIGFAGGCFMAIIVYGPMYLYGAYERANLSDRLSGKGGSNASD